MKAKVLVIAVLAVLTVGVGSASAFNYHLSFAQAEHGTRELARKSCANDNKCIASGVGKCLRFSLSRVDCIEQLLDETPYGEMECNTIIHWGVGPGGYLKFNYGKPYCFYLEEE